MSDTDAKVSEDVRAWAGGAKGASLVRRCMANVRRVSSIDLWDMEPSALTRTKRMLLKIARVVNLVLKGFKGDECALHASSLTFLSLLAVVPVLALSLSMARVFGAEERARGEIKKFSQKQLELFAGNLTPAAGASGASMEAEGEAEAVDVPADAAADAAAGAENAAPDEATPAGIGAEAISRPGGGGAPDHQAASDAGAGPAPAERVGAQDPSAGADALNAAEPQIAIAAEDGTPQIISMNHIEKWIDTAFERIEQLNFAALGGVGLLFLLWSVIEVLGHVELAFNRVWGVTEQRTIWRKFTDYLSVILVVPLLLVAASYIPAMEVVGKVMSKTGMSAVKMPVFGEKFFMVAATLMMFTLMFSFTLRFMPNTRVRIWPSIVGGFVTTLLSIAWFAVCMKFQVGVARYGLFFGGFATVPIVLSWVYVSWEILLFGAEVSFAVQNADTYRMEQGSTKASQRSRIMVAIDVMSEAARGVSGGDGLLRLREYARGRRVSMRLVNDVISCLCKQGFLSEVATEPGAFAVRKDLRKTKVASVVKAMLDVGDYGAIEHYAEAVKLSPAGAMMDGGLDGALSMTIAEYGERRDA